MVREECGRQRSWHDHETWSRLRHEVRSAAVVQWREKSVHAAAKIPNQTRLVKADSAEFHPWSQVIKGFPAKLIREKESSNDRGIELPSFPRPVCVRARARAGERLAACNAATSF